MDGPERKSCGVASCVGWDIRNMYDNRKFFCSTSDVVSVYVDAWWEAPRMKARSPKEFTDVRDVNESENNGCLSLRMTAKANRSIVKVEFGPIMSPARSRF